MHTLFFKFPFIPGFLGGNLPRSLYTFICFDKKIKLSSLKSKNTGWISKSCKMSRGISQGCPISVMFHISIAKSLAMKLKNNVMPKIG